jgi:hypothetical protein
MVKKTEAQRTKDWRKNNPEKVKAYAKMRWIRDRESIMKRLTDWRDKNVFGGNMFKAYERDNWECQECGMSQEQSILLFNRKLVIHHIDGKGRNSVIKNHDLDNLLTICPRCHGKINRAEQLNSQTKPTKNPSAEEVKTSLKRAIKKIKSLDKPTK